ncbi:MAG: hypothetical protein AAEB43_05770 [Acidimicrobiales bacterium]|jgi:ABC-type transport system involved in multi-copper enzyme maturation permease subunit
MNFFRLLGSEFERFLARRMARALVLVVMGIALIAGVAVFFNHEAENSSAARPAYNEFCVDEVLDQIFQDSGRDLPPEFGDFENLSEAEQRDLIGNAWCQDVYRQDRRFHATLLLDEGQYTDWSEQRPVVNRHITEDGKGLYWGLQGILPTIGLIIALLTGGLVGASFFGAEYRFGTIEQVLLWEPRRHRVILAKYLTVFFGSALVAMVASLSVVVALWPSALWRGTTEAVDTRFWIDLISVTGRIGIAAGLLGLIAGTVAIVTRHTAGAVMAMLGYNIIGGILIDLWLRWLRPWDPFFNLASFIGEGDTFKWKDFGRYHEQVFANTYLAAGLIGLVFALGCVALGTTIFRRRDVS